MTAGEFRRLALNLQGASEGAHQGHPDFRVAGKIFATLGYPDPGCAMVKLTPEQQRRFCEDGGDCFAPVNGAWGRRGATSVRLFGASADDLKRALALAHRNVTASLHRSPHRHAAGRNHERRPAAKRAS